jgi:Domain of unknown function (DUF4350)
VIGWLRRHQGDAIRAALAVAGLTLVAVLTKPPAEPALDTYSVNDVRSGGYAAWEELLQREDVAVESFAGRPVELDGTIDTLIDAYGVAPLPDEVRLNADTRALAAWVRRGGRLVLLGRNAATAAQEATLLNRPAERRAGVSGDPLRARAFGGAVEALATFSPERFARSNPSSRARTLLADRGGALIVRVPLGRGAIVYVSDPRLFDNAALARDDNARLAYLLARPRQPGRITAFDEALHGALLERGWLGTLTVPVRVALAGSVLTILIALAGGALRLGPPVTLRAPREPASDEFIAAVAALYRRANARRDAIAILAGGADGPGETAVQLRMLRERQTPSDADLIRSAALAHALRREHG